VRRLAPALVLVVVLAGCGGGGTEGATTLTSPPVTTASADPGKATISAFTAAARERSPAAMWRELSATSRDRLGPTRAAFERLSAPKLRKRFGSFRNYKVIVSERITSELGVVAIDDGRRVEAVALRLEGTTWKVELGGPVRIRLVGQPLLVQVAAAVEGPGGVGTAVMYIDGETVNPKVAGTASNSTLYANLVPALDPGRHTIVIFASDGREASAAAWAFTARE
jgi:hypothetical protein